MSAEADARGTHAGPAPRPRPIAAALLAAAAVPDFLSALRASVHSL